jgi:hypothetical protein
MFKMKHKKIIIWGVKLNSPNGHVHTNAYVHLGLYRAAQYLGLEVYWMDNRDNVSPDFFDDALILSEHSIATLHPISNNLPLRKSSTYIMNQLGNRLDKPTPGPGANYYLGKVGRIIDFRFRFDWQNEHYDYKFCSEKYTPVNEDRVSFIEFGKDCGQEYDNYYSLWASDLLPNEINFEDRFTPWIEPKYAFFSGTIRNQGGPGDNYHSFMRFIDACKQENIPFYFYDLWQASGMSPLDLKRESLKAFLAVEMRGNDLIDNGYVSCRNFKNISYGQLTMTNSKGAYEFFDGEIAYHKDPYELFFVASEMRKNPKTKDLVLNQMKKVKEKHTFVQRLRDFIKVSNI